MSRIAQPSSSRPSIKTPTTPTKSRGTTPASVRARTQSTRSTTPSKLSGKPAGSIAQNQVPDSAPLSIKEAIALRRAEAKKAQSQVNAGVLNDFISLEAASPLPIQKDLEEDNLGRWPLRETIERARSTGSLNIASRSLPCLPSALYEIHLGITPDSLKSVTNEPVLPPSTDVPRRGGRDNPTWFEAQDLQILKAWNNEIVEIQHEISLFGSLKHIDLHQNKLTTLPSAFGDLTALTHLDLSHNDLTSLPMNLFALPELTTLNISHNALTSLPFNAPFASGDTTHAKQPANTNFFTPSVTRATSPLPRLLIFNASHNNICANAIHLVLPKTLTRVDLSHNPLGIDEPQCRSLLQTFGALPKLRELRLNGAELGDDALPSTLFSSTPFPCLRVLDLEQTKVTRDILKEALKDMKQDITYDVTSEDPPEGVVCVILGKRIVKEAWELELEKREKIRQAKHADFDDWDTSAKKDSNSRINPKPYTELDAKVLHKSREVTKEAWELDAEQGLLTEGGKRRARAAAAAAANAPPSDHDSNNPADLSSSSPKSSTPVFSLTNPQYYSTTTQTLTLPSSTAPTKSTTHARAFSLTASFSLSPSSRSQDIAVPPPTLPLSIIVNQPFAQTLRALLLVNRRLDKSFSLPSVETPYGFLPNLEELNLEGCGLADLVSVTRSDPSSGDATPPRSSEMTLPLITKLFPSLQKLNLSHNVLTSASISTDVLSDLILASPGKKGLKHLQLNGNRISDVEGFQGLAELFKGNRQVLDWHLDELDIRDNEIGKLPPELGLLPLDVFLVEGNTFRIPQRRVWEREGTKGLLSWLRGRID